MTGKERSRDTARPAGQLAGQVAVIVGGAGGIGRSIAESFAQEGADLAIVDLRDPDETNDLLESIRDFGRRVIYVRTDIRVESDVTSMAESVSAELGPADILVNSAGVFSQSPTHELSLAEWDRIVEVNLRGVFLCSRAVLPQMLERRHGIIINIASQLGQIGAPGAAHYSASKGGVIAFTKALAREVARSGIRVNAIAPGPVLTDMIGGRVSEDLQAYLDQLPLGRIGQPEDVAASAVFLASEGAGHYIGQTLGPSGGEVML